MTVLDFDPTPQPDRQPDRQSDQPFTIASDEQATWAMRKLKAIRDKQAEIQSIADNEIRRVQEWADAQIGGLTGDGEFFENLLITYGQQERRKGRKVISTPYGFVKSRAGSKKTIIDENQFIPWAQQHAPELVKISQIPQKSEILRTCKTTDDGAVITDEGEIVPGVAIITGATTYRIEVSS